MQKTRLTSEDAIQGAHPAEVMGEAKRKRRWEEEKSSSSPVQPFLSFPKKRKKEKKKDRGDFAQNRRSKAQQAWTKTRLTYVQRYRPNNKGASRKARKKPPPMFHGWLCRSVAACLVVRRPDGIPRAPLVVGENVFRHQDSAGLHEGDRCVCATGHHVACRTKPTGEIAHSRSDRILAYF